MLVDGMTAANDLGISNAVPGQVVVHTDGRLRPIVLDNLTVQFKLTAPSKLYWAGRSAMKLIQAMHWLRNERKHANETDQSTMNAKLVRLLRDPDHGDAIRQDLQTGLHTVPAWMQQWLRELLNMACLPANEAPVLGTDVLRQFIDGKCKNRLRRFLMLGRRAAPQAPRRTAAEYGRFG